MKGAVRLNGSINNDSDDGRDRNGDDDRYNEQNRQNRLIIINCLSTSVTVNQLFHFPFPYQSCLLYTSDAADE